MKKYRTVFRIFLLFIGLSSLYLVATHYPFRVALGSSFSSLSPTTISLLRSFQKPIYFTLYSNNADTQRNVQSFIQRYQSFTPHIHYDEKTEFYAFSKDYLGEALVVHYEEHVRFLNLDKDPVTEATLSSLLFKFMRHANTWIVFLQGHGEPDLYDNGNRHISLWRRALLNQGFKVQPLVFSQTPYIADNVQLVVLASPHTQWLPQEEILLTQYLAKGGNLLWLMDPLAKSLPFLEKILGVHPLPGVIVDLHGQKLGTPHPAITLVENYPTLPFKSPDLLTAYPWSVALRLTPADWQTTPLLFSHEETWTEKGTLSGTIQYNPEQGEIAGPLLLGVSLSRTHPTEPHQSQRIAIIGNTRFMSNGVIQNYGNLAFGQNLMNWLNHDDQLLALEQPISSDSLFHIHLRTAYFIQYGFPGLGIVFLFFVILYSYYRHHNRN